MKLAVGYIRCSNDEQSSTSIPQQRGEIEKWARSNDFKIIEWFIDEGKSGTDFRKRPSFMRMTRTIEGSPRFQFVLVYDESRWGRAINPRENSYWKMHFEMRNVKVWIINSSSKQENDIGSYVTEVVESAEASEYSKKLSRAVRRGMLSSQQGKYSRGGTAPYGYKRVAIDLQTNERRELRAGSRAAPKVEKVVWELGDPLEIETVQRIFEMKISGKGCVSIADVLNAEGIPSPKRGRWRSKDRKWSGATVVGVLQNKSYVGERVYNRLCFSKFKARERGLTQFYYPAGVRPKFHNDRTEWIIVPLAHPEIVSEDIYLKVNTSFNGKQKTVGPRPNQYSYRSKYLLSGLITCSHCHFNYQGSHHNQSGNSYYIDGGFINKGKSVCTYHSIRQEVLEEFVLNSVREHLLENGMRLKIEQNLRQLLTNNATNVSRKMDNINIKLSDIESKIKTLISVAENGASFNSVTEKMPELEDLKRNLENEKGKLAQKSMTKVPDFELVAEKVLSFLRSFEERLQSVPMIEKKCMIRMVVEKIIVNRKTGEIDCYVKHLPSIREVELLNVEL